MNQLLSTTLGWLHRRAENILAALLLALFVTLLSLTVLRAVWDPWAIVGTEVVVVLWIWLVFFGVAFAVRERDQLRSVAVLAAVPRRVRRLMVVVGAVALLAIYAVSLHAVVDYVTFMKQERTEVLGLRFDVLYAIYVAFVVATLVRYVGIASHALRGVVDPHPHRHHHAAAAARTPAGGEGGR